jgi:PKD repeat protein
MLNPAPYASYRVGYELFGTGGNQPPVTVATGSSSGGDIPLMVSFSSAGSTDPDGSIAGYLWDFGDGSSSTEPDPAHTYTVPGSYVATLTITDDGGAQSVDTFAVAVSAPNILPIAVATADPPSGPAPLDVTFYASGSYDPDGSLGNFTWTFEDGSFYYGPTAYYTFNTNGVHPVTLTVYDSRLASASTTIYVYVGQPNQEPVAVASADPLTGAAPLDVDFSSAGSHDPDGDIVGYAWDFADGSSSTLPNPAHTYQFPGLYEASLTVTDDDGATASAVVEVQVDVAVYGLSLSPDRALDGKPGETVLYSLALTNTGNTPDTFLITTTVSGGQWDTSAPASVGPLNPGESAALPVQVIIPANVENGDQSLANVTATSAGESSTSASSVLTTTAQVSYGVSLSPATLEGSSAPGSTVAYTLTLTNSSDVALSIDISTQSIWAVDLSSAQLSLGAGESAELVASVNIPSGAGEGDQDSALVQADAVGQPGLSAVATLSTTAIAGSQAPVLLFLPIAVNGAGE